MILDRFAPTRARTLWALFILFIVLGALFGLAMTIWDFHIIDEMWNGPAILSHIEAMSPLQRRVHVWVTATLDVAYPLTYGVMLAGLARKAFAPGGGGALWLLLPAWLCIPVDLIEGLSQVMLLTGHEAWIGVKVIATPIKLALFITASLLGLAAASRLAWQRWGRKSA